MSRLLVAVLLSFACGAAAGWLAKDSKALAPPPKSSQPLDISQDLTVEPLLSDGKSKHKFAPFAYSVHRNEKQQLHDEPKDYKAIWVLHTPDRSLVVWMEKLPNEN